MANRGAIVVKKGKVIKGNNFSAPTPSSSAAPRKAPSPNVLSPDVTGAQTIKSPQTLASEGAFSKSAAGATITPSPVGSSPQRPAAAPPNVVRPSTEREARSATPFGQFQTGVVQGVMGGAVDSAGREIQTASAPQQIGFMLGAVSNIGAFRAIETAASRVSSGNTLTKTINVGKVSEVVPKTASETVAVNTKNVALTKSYLERVALELGKPKLVAFAVAAQIPAMIGSYPFAGFLKEEALQSLSMSTETALRNNDFLGAADAINMQREVLDVTVWEKIIGAVPYGNVLYSLKDFYRAAALKTEIDAKVLTDLRFKVETGETDSEFYARIAQEKADAKAAERLADEEYYAQVARNEAEAKAAERAEDERYWAKIRADRDNRTASRESQDEDYWSNYYKELAKYRDASAPSNLKFGLL